MFKTMVLAVVAGATSSIIVGGVAAKRIVDTVKTEGITINNVPVINSIRLQGGGNNITLPVAAQAEIDRLPLYMAGVFGVVTIAVLLGAGKNG